MKTKKSFLLFILISVQLVLCYKKCIPAPYQNAGNDIMVGPLNYSVTSAYTMGMWSKLSVDQMVENLDWIQQSCFRMSGEGVTIYIDPNAIKANSKPADYIFITHGDDDHFSPAEIKKIATSNTLVYGSANCKYTGICKEFITVLPGEAVSILPNLSIQTIPAYNSKHPKALQGLGYVINLDGVKVYHAGDTERTPEMKTIDCDIALLPLGQTYTMASVSEAAESAKDVKAEVAIPMHFGLWEGKTSDAETFKSLLEGQIKVVVKTRE